MKNNTASVRAFLLWEEVGASAENPHRHKKNMQAPHREAPTKIQRFSVWKDSARNHILHEYKNYTETEHVIQTSELKSPVYFSQHDTVHEKFL